MTLKRIAGFAGTTVWNFCAIQGIGSLTGTGDVRESIQITIIATVGALAGAWWYMRRYPERLVH